MTIVEHSPAPPEWEIAARRHRHLPVAFAEPDIDALAGVPTVLLPISPLAGFDRLRRDIGDDYRQLLDEIDDYLDTLGTAATPAATATAVATIPRWRRWLRRAPQLAGAEGQR